MLSIDADTVLVPLASETDAEQTCASLSENLRTDAQVVVVHVVEKAGGAPDKASVEQRKLRAEDIFAVARGILENGDRSVETEILYGTDVAETILGACEQFEAELVAFSPREASRLERFISGDTTLDLVTGTERPLLVLPPVEVPESEE